MVKRFFAKKTECAYGHKHDSSVEAKRCVALHIMQARGEIQELEVHPVFKFHIEGEPLKMGNGQVAKWKLDFSYKEAGDKIAEDVKSKGPWMDARELALKKALFRRLYPDWKLRETRR